MKRILSIFVLILTLLAAISCSNNNDDVDTNSDSSFETLTVAEDFNFSTLHDVEVEINVLNGNNQGIPNISFDFYSADPNDGGRYLYSGATGSNGSLHTLVTLPTALTSVYLVGYMDSKELPIESGLVSYTFGAKAEISKEAVTPPKSTLSYVLPYNYNGAPIGMDFDVLEQGFLEKVNATLPEGKPLQDYHPDYLSPDNQLNVVLIDQPADLWVTFVHEGAGNKNSLGYYTYQADNPPTSVADIDSIKVIFPNVSMWGSGGDLTPGDKVYLGQFDEGTVIAWVLMSNGWRYNQANITEDTWYSNYELNHNSIQQSILVYDGEYEKLLFAFEDLEVPFGDNDYNDAVFYATANPIESVEIIDIPPIDEPEDRDGDDVSDVFDDFPDDPTKAFETNDHTFSTLAYEDLWPNMGDYDFNDMVIDYNFFYHTLPGNTISHLIAEFKLMAIGARYQNGFAVQFPFSSDLIESITVIDGSDTLTYSDIVSNANFVPQLESGSKATIVFVHNSNDLMPNNGANFINTEYGASYVTPAEFAVDIKFNTYITNSGAWQWQQPFNPFIFIDRNRSKEVHLPDMPPTDQADLSLFNTGDDNSVIPASRYYRTANNLPWAINIASSWDHPYERKQVTEAYLKFKPWAESSGAVYPAWYSDEEGYRDNTKIYMIP